MSASEHRPGDCLNCGTALLGEYCHRCGQRAQSRRLPLLFLLRNLADEVFSLDSRLARTLRLLLVRPGELTRRYLEGRRTAHVPPLRLYAVLSFLLFLGAGAAGVRFMDISVRFEPADGTSTASAEPAPVEPTSAADRGAAADDGGIDSFLDRAMDNAQRHPDEADALVNRRLPQALILMVPILAALLKLTHRRSGRLFVEHLVFAVHVQSFVFCLGLAALVAVAVAAVLWPAVPLDEVVGRLLTVVASAYLFLALRRVYGEGRARTALKAVVLLLVYTVLVGVAVLALVLLAAARM